MIDAPDKTDAVALLRADHAAIYECFDRFLRNEPRSAQIANEVIKALEVLARMELDVFYPEVVSVSAAADALKSARNTHAQIQRQTDVLRQRLAVKADVSDAMVVLRTQVLAHFEEEERALFPAARAGLGAVLSDMAPALQACKNEAAGAGGVG